MLWLPIAVLFGVGIYANRGRSGSGSWCYGKICWLDDKAPECLEELQQVRVLSRSNSKSYRLDPLKTTASYLNRSFIRTAYRGRDFYVEHIDRQDNCARVFISFDDGTHMAFELERPCFDCARDIWVVRRYAYLDEFPCSRC